MKKKIAIIGAGVAGLTLGNLIKKNSSFEFMIYEKNETLLPENSYGIQLAVNSVSILNKMMVTVVVLTDSIITFYYISIRADSNIS